MGRINIRTQVAEILGQLVPRILAVASTQSRLPKFIQGIPWLGDLPATHPRITKVVIYWLVAAPMAFVVMLIQGAQTMAAALLNGGFLQVLQALAWLAVYSVPSEASSCRSGFCSTSSSCLVRSVACWSSA